MANNDRLVKGRYTEPTVRLTDPAFKYVPAKETDLRATFERVRVQKQRISPAQHAAIVLKNHTTFSGRRDGEYRTFAKPGETQEAAIKRFMATLKRRAKAEPVRQYPNTATALASTKAYVEEYYRLNFGGQFNEAPNHVEYVRQLFGELSTNPTTWPETDEVEVEIQP